jgi:hypothetical protein
MSNKTPVVPPAENPPTHGHEGKLAAEELANPDSTATCNPNIAEARKMANKHIKESEEIKNSGGGHSGRIGKLRKYNSA